MLTEHSCVSDPLPDAALSAVDAAPSVSASWGCWEAGRGREVRAVDEGRQRARAASRGPRGPGQAPRAQSRHSEAGPLDADGRRPPCSDIITTAICKPLGGGRPARGGAPEGRVVPSPASLHCPVLTRTRGPALLPGQCRGTRTPAPGCERAGGLTSPPGAPAIFLPVQPPTPGTAQVPDGGPQRD